MFFGEQMSCSTDKLVTLLLENNESCMEHINSCQDLDAWSSCGQTPLTASFEHGIYTDTLLEAGASPFARENNGTTPLGILVEKMDMVTKTDEEIGYSGLVALLLHYINESDDNVSEIDKLSGVSPYIRVYCGRVFCTHPHYMCLLAYDDFGELVQTAKCLGDDAIEVLSISLCVMLYGLGKSTPSVEVVRGMCAVGANPIRIVNIEGFKVSALGMTMRQWPRAKDIHKEMLLGALRHV